MDNQFLNSLATVESGGDPNAVNVNNNGTIDKGTFQLNSSNFPQYNLTPDSSPQEVDSAALQHMNKVQSQIGTADPNTMALAWHSGPNTQAINNGQIDPSKLTPEQTQYLTKFQNAYSGGGDPSQQQPSLMAQPYSPPANTSSLGGAYVKPNLLNILSGLAQVGGGMATDIIQARRRMPVTGGGLIENGSQTLNQQQEITAKYNQAQNLQQYLNDPNLDPNVRSTAAAYLRSGDINGALGVIQTSQNNANILNRQATIAGVRTAAEVQKQDELYNQKLQQKVSALDRYNVLGQKINDGTATQDDKNAYGAIGSLVASMPSAPISPFALPATRALIQKNVVDPLGKLQTGYQNANELSGILNNGLAAGRIQGTGSLIGYKFASNAEMERAKVLTQALQDTAASSILGLTGRSQSLIKSFGSTIPGAQSSQEEAIAGMRTIGGELDSAQNRIMGNFNSLVPQGYDLTQAQKELKQVINPNTGVNVIDKNKTLTNNPMTLDQKRILAKQLMGTQ